MPAAAAAGIPGAASTAHQQIGEQVRDEAAKDVAGDLKGRFGERRRRLCVYHAVHHVQTNCRTATDWVAGGGVFAAACRPKAAELNALGTSTTVDFYRQLIRPDASDAACVVASKCFTAFWGIVAAIGVRALRASGGVI